MFTDTQTQLITREFLLLPYTLNGGGNGLIQQKGFQEALIEEAEKHDEIYAIMFNAVMRDINMYHAKILSITGKKRTIYSIEDLITGSTGDGPHYPTGWDNFYPKLTLSVQGLPSNGTQLELNAEAEKEYTDINWLLGYVKQREDGLYEGKGLYYRLFQLICLRISKGDGTLTRVYDLKRSFPFLVKKIADANTQIKIISDHFVITQILSYTGTGQIEFSVLNLKGLNEGDRVKLMNDTGAVISRKITSVNIENNTIRVDTGVPICLDPRANGRVVKIK